MVAPPLWIEGVEYERLQGQELAHDSKGGWLSWNVVDILNLILVYLSILSAFPVTMLRYVV